jgi:hypothetical protein
LNTTVGYLMDGNEMKFAVYVKKFLTSPFYWTYIYDILHAQRENDT